METIEDIQKIIEASKEFRKELIVKLKKYPPLESAKNSLSVSTFNIVLEHSTSIHLLVENGLMISALSIFRMQYDAMIRQLWIQHLASELDIDKLSAKLTKESSQKSKNMLPSSIEMMNKLESKVHPNLFRMMVEFRTYSANFLNSMVHTGHHAIGRQIVGFHPVIISSLLKQSNNLLNVSAITLSEQFGYGQLMDEVMRLPESYGDCFQVR